MIRRTTVRGLAAAAMLLLLTIGVPVALFALAGSPVPGSLPGWGEITDAFGDSVQLPLLLGTLKYIAWAGWLAFTLSVIAEVAAAARGVKAPRLGPQQRLAATLVAAVAIGFAGPAAAAEAPPDQAVVAVATYAEPEPAQSTTSTSMPAPFAATGQDPKSPPPGYHARTLGEGEILWDVAEEELGDGLRYTEIFTASAGIIQPDGERIERPYLVKAGWTVWIPDQVDAAPASADRRHIVESGESLWDIAQRELGDGARYPEIFSANAGITQPDGGRLTDPRVIEPGWELRIPDAATARVVELPPRTEAPLAAATPLRPPAAEEHPEPEAQLDVTTPLAPSTPMLPPAAEEQPDAEVPLEVATPLSPVVLSAPIGDAPAIEQVDTTTPLDPRPLGLEDPRVVFTDDITGLTANFDASGTTSGDVAIASFLWMLGDGRRATGAAISHTYSSPGTYLVTVTATDEDGVTASASRRITVGPTDPPWGGRDAIGPTTPGAGRPPTGSASGPTDGPDASSTGVSDGTVLKTLSASAIPYPADTIVGPRIVIRTPGAVYDGWEFNHLVEVRAPGVTFRNSLFRGVDSVVPSAALLQVRNDRGGAGGVPSAVVEDSTFIPRNPNNQIDGVRGSNLTLTRVEITGTVDGVHIHGSTDRDDPFAGNVRITDSWIHDLAFYTESSHPDGTHNDGVQIVGGHNITIQGSRINGEIRNAAVMVGESRNRIGDLRIVGNWLGSGACTVNIYEDGKAMRGIAITGNRFLTGTQSVRGCATTISRATKAVTEVEDNSWLSADRGVALDVVGRA